MKLYNQQLSKEQMMRNINGLSFYLNEIIRLSYSNVWHCFSLAEMSSMTREDVLKIHNAMSCMIDQFYRIEKGFLNLIGERTYKDFPALLRAVNSVDDKLKRKEIQGYCDKENIKFEELKKINVREFCLLEVEEARELYIDLNMGDNGARIKAFADVLNRNNFGHVSLFDFMLITSALFNQTALVMKYFLDPMLEPDYTKFLISEIEIPNADVKIKTSNIAINIPLVIPFNLLVDEKFRANFNTFADPFKIKNDDHSIAMLPDNRRIFNDIRGNRHLSDFTQDLYKKIIFIMQIVISFPYLLFKACFGSRKSNVAQTFSRARSNGSGNMLSVSDEKIAQFNSGDQAKQEVLEKTSEDLQKEAEKAGKAEAEAENADEDADEDADEGVKQNIFLDTYSFIQKSCLEEQNEVSDSANSTQN